MTIKGNIKGEGNRERERGEREGAERKEEGGKKKYIPQMGDITSPRLPGNPAKLNKAAANTAVCLSSLQLLLYFTDDNSEWDE